MTPRPLTEQEAAITRWMIEHGHTSREEKARLLEQLDRATVVRRCPCGCASVDFAIDGDEADGVRGMRIVGDFVSDEGARVCGVFIFCRGTVLGGIEVYSLSGDSCAELPALDGLRAFP